MKAEEQMFSCKKEEKSRPVFVVGETIRAAKSFVQAVRELRHMAIRGVL